ncbi:MAG: 30S ribosomal protein S4 [Candidatus Norongarragalinales archaeon]
MGDPVRKSKKFEKPKRLWDKPRIEAEKALRNEFGLKNARELWRMQTLLRRIRREARRLLSGKGSQAEERAKKLLSRVQRLFLQKADATLDDLLSLNVKDILSRRLQSVVVRKGFAKTMHQARQFITHGHISIGGRKVSAPSYLVSFDEESKVEWFKKPVAVEQKPVVAEAAEGKEKEKVESVSANG